MHTDTREQVLTVHSLNVETRGFSLSRLLRSNVLATLCCLQVAFRLNPLGYM